MPQERHLVESLPVESFPSRLRGPVLFERNLKREWKEVRAVLNAWLEEASDLEGVLSRAREQMQRAWPGPRHWPPPSLLHAFTLARLGRTQEAFVELNAILGSDVRDLNGRLAMALQKASTR